MREKVFSVVHFAGDEVRTDASYYWDNAKRPDREAIAVQRTLSGAGFFEFKVTRQLVPPGFAMLFAQNEPSRYGYPPEAGEPYRLQFVAFSPAASVEVVFGKLREDFGSVVRLPEDSEACALFVEILERTNAHTFRDRYHETELLVRMLLALYREQVEGTRTSDPIEFGYHYLHNRFRRPINLKDVADQCRVTREHFIREFTRRYRETPGVMLRRLRLEHARLMLESTAVSVEEVALASGFANSDTFCRAYRREYRTSPGEVRRRR